MHQVILLLTPQNLPLSEGGQVFLSPTECTFCKNRAQNLGQYIAPCSLDFLTEVGRRLSAATGDARETAFLFQRISVNGSMRYSYMSLLSYPTSSRTSSHSKMCFSSCF